MALSHVSSSTSTAASRPSVDKSITQLDLEEGYDYSDLTPEKREKAWQYYGYPAFTRWMASANDFFVLRRFSPLQVRCLLYLQHQIATIDRRLQELDKKAREQGHSGYIDSDPEILDNDPRPRLLLEMIPLLQQYNDLVHSFSNMKAKSTVSEHQVQNVKNWFATYGENAISEDEQHWKNNDGDLFTMLSKPRYPIVALLHRSKFIRRCFKLKGRDDRSRSNSTTYTSNVGLDALATFIALFVGLSMTFGSIWWLNAVSSTVSRLAIITGSGSIIALLTWLAAGNRPFEILATFAAYMAVLMIYRQVV